MRLHRVAALLPACVVVGIAALPAIAQAQPYPPPYAQPPPYGPGPYGPGPYAQPPPPPLPPPQKPNRAIPASALYDTGLSAAIGLGVARQTVGIGNTTFESASGALFFHGAGVGSFHGISTRSRIAANIGGGQVGLDSRIGVEAFAGPALTLFDGTSILFHLGVQGYGLNNDEVRASMLQLPAAEIALLMHVGPVVVALGPQAGLALTTEYAPGDEDQGRRYRRKRTSDIGAGGFLSFTWEHFALDGSFTRITAKDPMWAADGNACIIVSPVALCGHAQYWRSSVALAQPGLPLAPDSPFDIPTLYLGFSLGLGVASVLHP
jgi:hypothetical protein